MDALVQRTRARGILSGVSNTQFRMQYIVRREDIQKGDVIITSGRHGYFPKGFVLGTVDSVSSSSTGVSYEGFIKPMVAIDRLEEVLIITEPRDKNQIQDMSLRVWNFPKLNNGFPWSKDSMVRA